MAATGELKARIQLLQAAKARAEAMGKTLKPEAQKELDSYSSQGLLGSSAAGSAGGKVSEGERKTAFLATRLAGSLNQLNAVPADERRPGWFQEAVRGVAPEAIANSITGSDRQRVEAAQADILDAALTLGTGAAYTAEQLSGYRKSYFPQLGDGDAVIADKNKRLATLLQSARIGAGGAAPQIDEALKKSGFAVPGADTKGGDQTSGTAGAVGAAATPPAGPTATPPAPGTPPQGDGDIGFNVAKPANEERLTADEEAQFAAFLPTATPESIVKWIGDRGLVITPEAAQNAIDAFKKTGVAPQFGYVKPEVDITDVRGEGGVAEGARAFVRGIPAVVGLDDELNAVLDGGDYEKALQKERAISAYDEQNNFLPRLAGQVVAGAAIPSGATGAARAAGIAAIRGGATKEAAQAVAARVFATRTAQEAAGLGGAYGAGNAEGGIVDRAAGAVTGAAVGAAAGGATGYAGSRIAQALRARAAARGTAGLTPGQETLAAAERQDIVPFPADVGGTMTRRATSAAAQTIVGGAPIVAAARRTVNSAEAVRNRVAASIGAPQNIEAAGETARAGAQAFIARTSTRGNALYRQAEQTAGTATVDTPEALRVLNQELPALEEAAVPNPALPILQGLRDGLQSPSTVRGLRNTRTAIRSAFEGAGLRGSNEERIANRVVDAAADDITNGLRAQGLDQAAQQYRVADRYWRERLATIDDNLEPILGNANNPKSGEQIVQGLKAAMAGNNRRFAGFVAALPPQEQSTVRASLIQRMGQASKGQQDEGGEVFSLGTFLTNWNDIGERAKQSLFGAEGRAALNDLARYASGSKEAQRFANHSNSGGAIGNLGTLGSAALGLKTLGLTLGTQYGAGRLLASPRFARWIARAPAAPTPNASRAYVARLTRIARAEPAIANEVLDLQRRLAEVFTVSPTRLAANEGPNGNAPVEGNTGDPQANQQGLQP